MGRKKEIGGCGNEECMVSTGISGATTFGSGELDEYGYWEEPCTICARAWEKLYPGDWAWPRARVLWFDTKEYFAEGFLYIIVNEIPIPFMPKPDSLPVDEMWEVGIPCYGDLNPTAKKIEPFGLTLGTNLSNMVEYYEGFELVFNHS